MYCAYCGSQLLDGSNFCQSCGNNFKLANIPNQNTDISTLTDKDEIDRQMVISHLLDIRTLEFARNTIYQRIKETTNKIESLCISENIKFIETRHRVLSAFIGLLIFGFVNYVFFIFSALLSPKPIGSVATGIYFKGLTSQGEIILIISMIVSFILSLVLSTIPFTMFKKTYFKAKSEYERNIEQNNNRLQKEKLEQDQLQKDLAIYNSEYQKATNVLQRAYSVNIIPLQFRNIYGVYYLYDYLSTSRESLQSALMNYNLDAIKARLDRVISNQEDIISIQYIQCAKMDFMAEQNKHIIKIAQSIENSSQNAARYAGIAASNTEAIAYFKLSEYFRQS